MRDLFSLNPRPEAFNASLLMQWKQIHIFTAEKVTNQTCIRYIFTTIQILFVDIVFALIIPKNSAVLCIWFLYSSTKWKTNPTMIKYRPSLLRETRGSESRGAKTAFYQNQPYQRVAVWEEWECDGFFLYFQFSHSFFTFLCKMFKNHSFIQYCERIFVLFCSMTKKYFS